MQKLLVVLKILFLLKLLNVSCRIFNEKYTNNYRPIIGILSQEFSPFIKNKYPGLNKTYIAASYVKYVESAGARVIPIRIGQPESYYEDIMKNINGVLFPGGDADFNATNGYADAGEIIYRIAERFNKNGDYFPIWGTCLGFELLTYLAANRSEHRTRCHSNNQPLPLEFTQDYKNSKLFKKFPDGIINVLREENVTANYHYFCTTDEGLAKVNLQYKFRVLSYNHDLKNLKFISVIEHLQMPFYGVQFHPEVNIFEWSKKRKYPHTPNAIKVSQHFSNFFVKEARKNEHAFTDEKEENESLIYNFPPTYTSKKIGYSQCYFL